MENTIISEHPLCRAKWIWPGAYLYLHNHFAHLRKDFELSLIPDQAPFFITADYSYRLYVNGNYICRGPARGYQAHWPFDELDLSQYLKPGHNWIAVEGYNPGISTFSYLHETCAGFICAAEWEDFKLYSDENWQMRRCPAHIADTDRHSLQLLFQEHLSAKNAERNWIYCPEKPDWPEKLSATDSFHSNFMFGRAPYFSVEERGIPMLREEIQSPEKIISTASGKCRKGYASWKNVCWEFAKECEAATWTPGITAEEKRENGLAFELSETGADRFEAALIDVGEFFIGTLNVSINGSCEEGILDFIFSEGISEIQPDYPSDGGGCFAAMGNRIFLSNGDFQHEFHHPLGFRYIIVVGRNLKETLNLEINLRTYQYPFSMKGEFNCSDNNLNELHAICRRTQQICALDAYVDTPWREQAQWWGDARVQAENTFFLDGDARLLKRGIRSIAGQKTPCGLTYGHAPTSAHGCVLPDFSLTWILTIWDYYWQTGDSSLLGEQWPRIQEVLNYFDRPEVRSESGLLIHDTRLWYFGDWAKLYKGHVPSFLNLWYLHALERLSEMLCVAGLEVESEMIARKAKVHKELIIEKLYDRDEQLIVNGLDEREEVAPGYSVHDQVLAIMLKLAPEAEESMLRKQILPFIDMENQESAIPSPFWATYPFEVLRESGYGSKVIDFIKEKWNPMLATGTTWENYSWTPSSSESCSHAWTAHPCFHFVKILSGVTQKSVAWKSVKIKPVFIDSVDFANSLIPSPQGDIKSSWKRIDGAIEMTVELPPGVEAELCLDTGKRIIHGPCSHKITVN